MKKLILVFLVILLISCGNSKASEVSKIKVAAIAPTLVPSLIPTESPTATLIPTKVSEPTEIIVAENQNFANSIISMDSQNYAEKIQSAIEITDFYNPEIGSKLHKCEIGIANSEGYEVTVRKNSDTCLILYVPISLAVNKKFFSKMLVSDSNQNYIVAMTQLIGEEAYPFIFLADGKFDLFYLARVLAHEGFHMINLLGAKDCVETKACEEAHAYEVQFKLLEKMYSQDVLDLGYKHYALKGSTSYNLQALEMEQILYQKWKSGNLETFLSEIGYGGN